MIFHKVVCFYILLLSLSSGLRTPQFLDFIIHLKMDFLLIRTFSIRVAKVRKKSTLRKCTFVSALIGCQTWTLSSVHSTGRLDTISWTDDGQLLAVSTQLGKYESIVLGTETKIATVWLRR